MKKIIVNLFSFGQKIKEMIWPEKCPTCDEKLHKQGHRATPGKTSKLCLNPDCEWVQPLKPQKNRS